MTFHNVLQVVIEDVVTSDVCVCRTEEGRLVEGKS